MGGVKKNILILLLFLALGFAAYGNSLNNGFVIDDYDYILHNRTVHNWKSLWAWLMPSAEGRLGIVSFEDEVFYRPILRIIPGICFIFFRAEPVGYRVVNTIFLALASFVVFWGLRKMTKRPGLSFVTGVLFAIHPINGLCVNYVVASAYAIQVALMMLSLTAFFQYARHRKFIYAVFAFFCWLGALLCHETAMVMPFYFLLLSLILLKMEVKRSIWTVLPFFLILGVYFVFRLNFASFQVNIFDKILQNRISVCDFLSAFSQIVLYSLQTLLFLKDIVMIWAVDFFKGHVVWRCVGLLMLLSGVCFFYTRYSKKYPDIVLGLLWYGIGFIPVVFACFFNQALGMMFEPHWMFFSHIGFFILIGLVVDYLYKKNRAVSVVFFLSIAICYLVSGWRYNALWGNQVEYLTYWGKVVPRYQNIQIWLADVFWEKGNTDKAKELFRLNLSGGTADGKIYNNLGLLALLEKHYDEAEIYFNKALLLVERKDRIYTNLGVLFFECRDWERAETYLRKAIYYNVFNIESRLILAQILMNTGRRKDALVFLNEAQEIAPSDKMVLKGFIAFYSDEEDSAIFEMMLKKYLHSYNSQGDYVEMAQLLALKDHFFIAKDLYEQAIGIDPGNADVYVEYGKMLADYNQFDQAIDVWQRGTAAAPELADDFFVLTTFIQTLQQNIQNSK